LRAMLADEVRLDLVAKARLSGRAQVGTYYVQYERIADWRFALGSVDGRLAALAFDPHDPAAAPIYFVLLNWDGDRLVGIRDFRYARYAVEGAEFATLA
ncbi:MAG TPA: RNA polymerase sigma factor, partial [Rudaea sp.]